MGLVGRGACAALSVLGWYLKRQPEQSDCSCQNPRELSGGEAFLMRKPNFTPPPLPASFHSNLHSFRGSQSFTQMPLIPLDIRVMLFFSRLYDQIRLLRLEKLGIDDSALLVPIFQAFRAPDQLEAEEWQCGALRKGCLLVVLRFPD